MSLYMKRQSKMDIHGHRRHCAQDTEMRQKSKQNNNNNKTKTKFQKSNNKSNKKQQQQQKMTKMSIMDINNKLRVTPEVFAKGKQLTITFQQQ